MLSAIPLAIFPNVEAVQGAINIASAHKPSLTCEFQVPSRCEKNSLTTGFWVSVDRVMGVMNSLPANQSSDDVACLVGSDGARYT